jgi:hypothetical protein
MDTTKSDQVWSALVRSIHRGAIVAATKREADAVSDHGTLPATAGIPKVPFFGP